MRLSSRPSVLRDDHIPLRSARSFAPAAERRLSHEPNHSHNAAIYRAGTRCFNSSVQLRTTWMVAVDPVCVTSGATTPTKRLPSGGHRYRLASHLHVRERVHRSSPTVLYSLSKSLGASRCWPLKI